MNDKKVTMHPAGPAFEELTLEEMVASQGSGDIINITTPQSPIMTLITLTPQISITSVR